MAENGRKWVAAGKWQEMDFRVFLVMVIEVARKTMAEMAENGRKWQKMGCRGYLVGNGFPRVSRRGHRDSQAGNGRKWPKMVENGRKIFRALCAMAIKVAR